MTRLLLAALLAAAVAAAAAVHEVDSVTPTSSESPSSTRGDAEHEPESDDEGDSAPFTIVVQHADGWRCGGSLVSLRTALTSAQCARGRGARPARQLWVLAPAPPAPPVTRRVARVALAGGVGSAPSAGWEAATADLAVLELEEPFAGEARARPILMATRASECAAPAACHAVRALGRAPRLRIVDATLAPPERCAARARGWAAVREAALCLVGPALCASDWGAGVVCEGKLCGVVSRSVVGAGPPTATVAGDARDDSCGDTHVAQSVARWRRFLHCAHTLRACGRGGECAQLCTERRLLESEAGDETGASGTRTMGRPGEAAGWPGEAARSGEAIRWRGEEAGWPDVAAGWLGEAARQHDATRPTELPRAAIAGPHRTLQYSASTSAGTASGSASSPSVSRPTRSTSTSATPSEPLPAGFEPNRPDFKAGEYGDNVMEYGGEESGGAAPATAAAATPPPLPPPPPPPTPAAELAARRQAAAAPPVRSAAWPPRAAPLFTIAALLNILV